MFKAGFVGLIGLPNAGKSSFLNHILGENLAIVSSKPQATRKRVTGIHTSDKGQILFVDAPGFLQKGKNPLTSFIAEEARAVVKDVDAVMLLVSCEDLNSKALMPLIEIIENSKKPWIAVLTKRDLKEVSTLPGFISFCISRNVKHYNYSTKNPAKAEKEEILQALLELLPESPAPLYDPELYTIERTRDIAGEMVRERCFELLKDEIPFGLAVHVSKYDDTGKILRIEASILVEKENHRGIVIGAKGAMLKKIGSEARKKIEKITGEKVYLALHVSYKKDWMKKAMTMKELGYES